MPRVILSGVSHAEWDSARPWARQPSDSELGFALFGDYLALPLPRRLQGLVKAGCPLTWTQLETLSRDGWWRERAACWDEHLAEIRTLTIERVTEETAEDVARRQLALTRRMQRLADKELSYLEKAAENANGFPGTILPRDATRLAMAGIRLERLILGEATERTDTGPDLSHLSLEDLRQARAIQAKAGVR